MKTIAPERRVDFAAIRADFPIFLQKVHGKPLIYLDSTATTQKPRQVLEAQDHYYRTYNANIHRGVYQIAEEATARYEEARGKVARLVNARSTREIIFTRGTTESVNLVAYSWGRKNIKGALVSPIILEAAGKLKWELKNDGLPTAISARGPRYTSW